MLHKVSVLVNNFIKSDLNNVPILVFPLHVSDVAGKVGRVGGTRVDQVEGGTQG